MVNRSQERQTTSAHLLAVVIPAIEHQPDCPLLAERGVMAVSDASCLCYEVGLFNAGLTVALAAIIDDDVTDRDSALQAIRDEKVVL